MKHFILDYVKLNACIFLFFIFCFFFFFFFSILDFPGTGENSSNCKLCPPPTTNNFMSAFLVGKKKKQHKTKQVLIWLCLLKNLDPIGSQNMLHLQIQQSLYKNSSPHGRSHQQNSQGSCRYVSLYSSLLFSLPSSLSLVALYLLQAGSK